MSIPRGLIPVFIVVATLLTLWPVCTGEFTSWDDPQTIAQNPTLLPPTWNGVAEWWSKPIGDLYIPVTYSAWGLLALVGHSAGVKEPDLNPAVFHSANLLLHLLAILVVFRLLALLVRRSWPAAAGAALFALHPVQVEPVAWASGLKDVLCGLLSLVALWQYLLSVQPPDEREKGSRRGWHFALATVAFGLALLSKPTAVIVPIMAAVLHRAIRPSRPRWDGLAWRLGIWVAMAIPMMLIAHVAQPLQRAIEYVPIRHRPLVAADAVSFYIGKLVWPTDQGIDYGRTPERIFATGQAYWTWVIPVAIAAGLVIWARRRRLILAGASVFVIGLLPVLGLVGFDFQGISTVADRYLYLPMFGVALAAAALLASPAVARHARLAIAAVLCALGLLALDSFLLAWVWHDAKMLFSHALAVNPQSGAVNDSLCDIALGEGRFEDAFAYAGRSIAGDPRRPHGWAKLAGVYAAEGDTKHAVAAMTKAYELDPLEPRVVIQLGIKLESNRQYQAAADRFREALRLDPDNASAELLLGLDLTESGQPADGLAHARRAAQLEPDNPRVQLVLGDCLRHAGLPDEARTAYEAALRLQPGYVKAIDGLRQLDAR